MDLSLSPYHVAMNDPLAATENRDAIAAAIADCVSRGARADLHLPDGDCHVTWNSTTRAAIGFFGGASDFHLSGAGQFATRIIVEGDAALSDRYGIAISGGAQRIEISGLSIQHGVVTNPDPGDQCHLIRIGGSTVAGVQDITLHDLYFGACIGDQLNLIGNPGALTAVVKAHSLIMRGQGIGPGARSCLGMQRGVVDFTLRDVFMQGAKNSPIDYEPTGTGLLVDHLLDNIKVDNSLGRTQVAVSLGGSTNDANSRLNRCTVRDLTVIEGGVTIADAIEISLIRLRSYMQGLPGSPLAGTACVPLMLFGDVQSCTVTDPKIIRDAGGSLTPANSVYAVYHTGRGFPNRVLLRDGYIEAHHDGAPIKLDSVLAPSVNGTRVRYMGTAPATNRAVLVTTAGGSVTAPQISGVVVESPNGKLKEVVELNAVGGHAITNATVRDVAAAGQCSAGVLLSQTGTGSAVDLTPAISGCDFTGAASVCVGPAGTAPVTSGNHGGAIGP